MGARLQAKHKASEVTERGKDTAQEAVASSQRSTHHVLPPVGFVSLWLGGRPAALLPGRAVLQQCSGLGQSCDGGTPGFATWGRPWLSGRCLPGLHDTVACNQMGAVWLACF